MKKLLRARVIPLCLFIALFLFGCTAQEDISVYTCEKDSSVYTLTLNDTQGTFLLIDKRADYAPIEYEGTFTEPNGTVLLCNERFGYRTVVLAGDSFYFIANPAGYEGKEMPSPQDICDHVWDEGSVTNSASCLEYGVCKYTCTKCGATKSVNTTKGEHTFSEEYRNGKNCKANQVLVCTCQTCGQVVEKKTDKPSTNHNYEETEEEKSDCTCMTRVTVKYVCSVCRAEKYDAPSGQSYIGKHDYKEGVCTLCGYADNGASLSGHKDGNKDGYCDNCFIAMEVLNGIRENGYYEEENRIYLGSFPQQVTSITFETLEKYALYDKDIGCYYYGGETYYVRSAVKDMSAYTFADGGKVENKKYVFVCQPLCWAPMDGLDLSKGYGLTNAVEVKCFLDETYLVEKNTVWKNRLYEDADANDYAYSSIQKYLTTYFTEHAFSSSQRALLIAEVTLCGFADVGGKTGSLARTITDYALLQGIGYGTNRQVGWFLSAAVADTVEEDKSKYAISVDLTGNFVETSVSVFRGVVPKIFPIEFGNK